jgi:hypothetical protein
VAFACADLHPSEVDHKKSDPSITVPPVSRPLLQLHHLLPPPLPWVRWRDVGSARNALVIREAGLNHAYHMPGWILGWNCSVC